MRPLLIICLTYLQAVIGIAQSNTPIRLETCYALARENYPSIKQFDLIAKSADYSLENISKGYYPQVTINGTASYQSAVTQLPIKLPGVNIETISKDQYKLYADITQVIYDGGAIANQKEAIEANAAIEKQKVEIELYKLKERINQLYFGILLADAQLNQVALVQRDLKIGIDRLNAAIENGITLKNSVDGLMVEQLKVDQKVIELKASRKAFIAMLGLFINQTLSDSASFEMPILQNKILTNQRPELLLFYNQNKWLEIQNKTIDIKSRPKVAGFVQAGYGRPALNMLNNEFTGYYVGGIRLSWSLSGFYTAKKERAILAINRSLVEVQKENFIFNSNTALQQQSNETEKYEALMLTDDRIITLRTRIKNTALSQLENGTITSSDYVREVNAEDQAKQNKLIHNIQLLISEYNQQNILGN